MKHLILTTLMAAATLGLGTAAQAYSGEQFVVCDLNPDGDNFLALRSCGSAKCAMQDKLGPGTFLVTMNPTGTKGWREVIVQQNIQDWSYAGPSGWVYEKYICLVDHTK